MRHISYKNDLLYQITAMFAKQLSNLLSQHDLKIGSKMRASVTLKIHYVQLARK